MIRAGLIGAGFIGPVHVEALRRLGDVEVVALAASGRASATAKARSLGIPRAYGDWHDLIRDRNVEVVHNCTPNAMHREVSLAAIAAGKHVVAEKPLAVSSRETLELVQALQATKLVGAVCFNYRMYPMVQEARARVAAGELGRVWLVYGHYLQDWLLHDTDYNWRVDPQSAGPSRAMADIGSHWCDLVEFVTGLRVVAVCADLATFLPLRLRPASRAETFATAVSSAVARRRVAVATEDSGSLLLQLESAARGACMISQVSAGHKNDLHLEVNGAASSLAWDQEAPENLWLGHRDGPNEVLAKDPALLSSAAQGFAHFPAGHGEAYPDSFRNLLAHVYGFIRDGRDPRRETPDFPTFEDGHRSAVVIEAILESHRIRGWASVAIAGATVQPLPTPLRPEPPQRDVARPPLTARRGGGII